MTTLISTEIRDNFAPPQSGVAPIARHDSNDSIDLAESVAGMRDLLSREFHLTKTHLFGWQKI